ncbi:unnamed protein product [Eretmochelys imbricata]
MSRGAPRGSRRCPPVAAGGRTGPRPPWLSSASSRNRSPWPPSCSYGTRPGGAPYPDYDETGAGAPPRTRPPAPPQLSRYRTDGAYESHQDEPGDEEPGEMDAEMLRYLVGRILAGGGETRPPRHPRRLRRGLEEEPPTLLRVKRLGDDGEGPEAGAPQLQRAKRTEEEEEEAGGGRRGVYGGEPLLRYLPE